MNSRNNGSPPRTPRQTGRAPPPLRLRRRPGRTRPPSPTGGDDVNPLWAPRYTPPPGTNVGPQRNIEAQRPLRNRSNRRARLPNRRIRQPNVRRNLDNEHFRRIHQNEQNRQNNIQHRNYHDHTIPFDQRPDYDPSTQRNPNGSSRMPEPEQQTLKF